MILLVLTLAACSPAAVVPRTYRAPDAPIYSSAVVEPARLSGNWVQVAGFTPDGLAQCGPGHVRIDGGTIRWDLCLSIGGAKGAGPFTPGKPGRFAVDGMTDWWVLWVDGDYRTLVIGTPSGDFGFVLNREADMPADRMQAVRDILRFNGYNTAELVIF